MIEAQLLFVLLEQLSVASGSQFEPRGAALLMHFK